MFALFIKQSGIIFYRTHIISEKYFLFGGKKVSKEKGFASFRPDQAKAEIKEDKKNKPQNGYGCKGKK